MRDLSVMVWSINVTEGLHEFLVYLWLFGWLPFLVDVLFL